MVNFQARKLQTQKADQRLKIEEEPLQSTSIVLTTFTHLSFQMFQLN